MKDIAAAIGQGKGSICPRAQGAAGTRCSKVSWKRARGAAKAAPDEEEVEAEAEEEEGRRAVARLAAGVHGNGAGGAPRGGSARQSGRR